MPSATPVTNQSVYSNMPINTSMPPLPEKAVLLKPADTAWENSKTVFKTSDERKTQEAFHCFYLHAKEPPTDSEHATKTSLITNPYHAFITLRDAAHGDYHGSFDITCLDKDYHMLTIQLGSDTLSYHYPSTDNDYKMLSSTFNFLKKIDSHYDDIVMEHGNNEQAISSLDTWPLETQDNNTQTPEIQQVLIDTPILKMSEETQ